MVELHDKIAEVSSMNDSDELVEAFAKLTELLTNAIKEQRTQHAIALEEDDWEQAQEIMRSSYENISMLKQWIQQLYVLQNEITTSNVVKRSITKQTMSNKLDVENQPLQPNHTPEKVETIDESDEYIESDDVKIGKYIRGKLRLLSDNGFVFTSSQISELCDVEWSKKIFSYNRILAFAKRVNLSVSLTEQIKDENGHGRYWKEPFVFGDVELLIVSQWYAKDKDSFDEWYNNLISSIDNHDDVINSDIFESTVASTAASTATSTTTSQRVKPTKFVLFGNEYAVSAWNDVFIKVCEIMLLMNPYKMAAMDKDAEFNTERRTNFSYIESEIKFNGKRLSNGLWVETNQSSGDIIRRCQNLLGKCGFSPDELKIETVEVCYNECMG